MSKTKIVILGAGRMGRAHAEAYQAMPDAEVVGVVDVNTEGAAAFAADFGGVPHFPTVEEAAAALDFDAVSNVTPDGVHHATTLAALAEGKHVLCEKPLAPTYADAAEMAEAAAKAGAVNMVNLTYRQVPAMRLAAELVAEGRIGTVRHVQASYLQSWLTQPAWGDWKTDPTWLWRLSSAHGSMGVLGDVGIHILDFATYVAGADVAEVSGRLKTFDKASGGKIGEYILDVNDSCLMNLALTNGAQASVTATRFATGHVNDLILSVHGDKAGLEVRYIGAKSSLRICEGEDRLTGTWRDLPAPEVASNYRAFVTAIRDGGPQDPDFARGAALQRVLDAAAASDAQSGLCIRIDT